MAWEWRENNREQAKDRRAEPGEIMVHSLA
jgi:hypothetical protein